MRKAFLKVCAAVLCLLAAIPFAGCAGTGKGDGGTSGTEETGFVPSPDGTVRYYVCGPEETVFGIKPAKVPGYVSGRRVQSPGQDGEYTPVRAVPMLGYRFLRWSDGKTDPTRVETPGEAPASVTAIFGYDFLDMPVMSVITETGQDVTSKDTYISCAVIATDTGGQVLYESDGANIRGRGNSTWHMEKKSYRIKLPEKANLLGVGTGKARSWVLLANHCDHSLQRVSTAFAMARMLSGFDYVPGCRFVELYLNGEYRGVYLLTEQTQTGKSRVSINEEDVQINPRPEFLVEKTAWDYEYGFTVKGERYGIKSDLSENEEIRNAQIEWIDERVTEAYDALAEGNYDRVKMLVDVDSLIDDYLLQEITKNFDVGFDSFYMYYKDGKLYFGPPWDFDLSLGNANLGFEDYEGLSAALCPTNPEFDTSNRWFYSSVKHAWFRKLVIDRWNEIKGEISDLPGLVAGTEALYGRSFERNFEKWDIFGKNFARTTKALLEIDSCRGHCEYLSRWIENRIGWLDGLFNSKEFARGRLTGG